MAGSSLLTFLLAAAIMVAIPGPNVMFTVGRAIALGRLGGLLTIVGTALGSLLIVGAVAAGIGTVLAASAEALATVKIVGAAYLAYLGITAIRHRGHAAVIAEPIVPRARLRHLSQGFIVGVTNPKSIAFFVAVLPQFVTANAGALPMQLLALGSIVVVIGLACDSIWVLAATAARAWFARSPRRIEAMSVTGGGLMIALAVALLLWRERAVSA
jgi:threonine/homoserine/homoserine lactone efflux protein